MTDLFATGRIFMIRKPIRANFGPDRIFDLLTSGYFGIDVTTNHEETYVVFINKRRKILLIFHIDDYGYELTKRKLYAKTGFRLDLLEDIKVETLTRESLRRLVLFGSYEEDFEAVKQENKELKRRLQVVQPAAAM